MELIKGGRGVWQHLQELAVGVRRGDWGGGWRSRCEEPGPCALWTLWAGDSPAHWRLLATKLCPTKRWEIYSIKKTAREMIQLQVCSDIQVQTQGLWGKRSCKASSCLWPWATTRVAPVDAKCWWRNHLFPPGQLTLGLKWLFSSFSCSGSSFSSLV